MKIRFKVPDSEWTVLDVPRGSSLEEIYKDHGGAAPYKCVAARVDNEYQGLTFKLGEGASGETCDAHETDGPDDPQGGFDHSVELLDVRDLGACRVYQAGITMVFLAAAGKVMAGATCVMANTLAHGIFIELKGTKGATDELADRIRCEMQSVIDRDVRFRKEHMKREDAVRTLKETGGSPEKIRLIESMPGKEWLDVYELDGYRECMQTVMVPSSGYVKVFSLERYRKGFLLRFPDREHPWSLPEFVDEPNMYKAFAEQNEWDRLLGVAYVSDLNEKIGRGEHRELILLSEALHDKKITEIAGRITEEGRRLVLIAGPSSSGKTTFAKRLCIHLRVNGLRALYMGTDDYFVDRADMKPDENGEYDFENLDAVDTRLFNDNMRDLLAGKEVDIPEFDFIEGRKMFGRRKTVIDSKTVIVIEGIHALNELLTSEIPKDDKFKIYISPLTGLNIDEHNRVPTTDERLLRRIVRDERTRGRSAAETISDWPKVRRGEDRNIFRYNNDADVMFNSYHVYEIAVLKKYVEPLLKAIRRDEPEYAEAGRLLAILSFFSEISDTGVIVNDSIIREFIGGSIYVS